MPRLNVAVSLDTGLERWLIKTATKNFWRVASYYELEDLIADGYMVYAECRERYKDRVHERRHFMALFRTCFLNHITDLTNKRSRELAVETPGERVQNAERVSLSDFASIEDFGDICPPTLPDAEIAVLLQQTKGPVQLVLRLFYTDAGIRLLRETPQNPRETLNAYYCRLLGLDDKATNIYELFKSCLAGRGPYYMRRRTVS